MSLCSLALRALALSLIASLAASASAATRVDLVIDEATPNRTVAWPVTTGVPFPQGGLVKAEQCRLVDDTGREQPLQSKVAATWDAARTSIRWLTIDFIAHPQRKYALEFGPEIQRSIFESPLHVADAGDAGDSIGFDSKARVAVATGPLHVEFSQSGPAVLRAVRADLNGDGKIADEETVTGLNHDPDFFDQDRILVPSNGKDDSADRKVVVETSGPVRTTIRVDGWYAGTDGKRVVAYRTRYHLFAGLSVVKLIDEFRILGSTRDVKFDQISIQLSVPQPLRTNGRVSVADPTKTGRDAFRSIALHPNHHHIRLTQETFRHYGNPECRGTFSQDIITPQKRSPEQPLGVLFLDVENKEHFQADRVGPWMQVADDRCSVTGSLRNFWQQFPKGWEYRTDFGALYLRLWCKEPEGDPLDFGQPGLEKFFGPAGMKYLLNWKSGGGSSPISDFFYYAGRVGMERDGADGRGINKHHEIWYHFGRANEAAAGREYGALADKQPLCLATGAWNVGTGVFGPLAARPNDSPYEKIFDNIFDLQRKAQDDFGDYGWFLFGAGPHYSYQWDKETKKHYADPRRFEYHTYQRETQYWWSYLRSGERKFYDWCFPSENHWVDIAVSHVPLMYSTEWRGGAKGDAKLHYPAGDWSIDSPLHYVRHHDTGEAWLRSASQYWGSYHRTLETTTLAYYLTGDERYNDVVQFWKDYWGPLAGIRSDSTTAKPWHMDQMWWEPTKQGEPSKTWAEMIRDYAPFQSGSRHQQTLFFNLSTLYEHTWDPTIKKVLDEYAAAFIKPENPNGVWQCQDHHLPANADSPMLAHYWAPALWKYARASGDKRMPEVLKKYFTACLDADPYGCDVGIYSNNQIAWAWHFTKDPRALTAAQHQLDKLLPFAQPPAKPEDLGGLIYNPYMPIMISATVPRAIGILADAKAQGIAVPPAPLLEPQRTLIAIANPPGAQRGGVLWGWDDKLAVVDETGKPCATTKVAVHRSNKQPFDRALPGFQVFRTEFTGLGDVGPAWSFVSPKLETGVLELDDERGIVWCWAGEPIHLEERKPWYWRRPSGAKSLVLEAARVAYLQVAYEGTLLPMKVVKNRATYDLSNVPADALLTIESANGNERWFRIVEPANADCWVSAVKPFDRSGAAWPMPPTPTKLIEARRKPALEVEGVTAAGPSVAGRFGKAIYVSAGTEFRIPDEHTSADGKRTRLSDQKQGCLEFWIRRFGDERAEYLPGQMVMQAGSIFASLPKHVPLAEWTHVAVDWYPQLGRPEQSLVSVYVNGVDHGNYRSIYWDGYGDRVGSFSDKRPWLGAFHIVAPPNAPFALDDVRLSNAPRYTDPTTKFGRAQTFNPKSFPVPTKPAELDGTTVLLAPLDGLLGGDVQTKLGPLPIVVIQKKK